MNEVPGLVSSGEYHRIIVLGRQGGGEIHVLDCSSNSANKGVAML